MIKTKTLLAAIVLDLLVGDPEDVPHPVRAIGAGISTGEKLMRRYTTTPERELLGGALLSLVIIGGSFLAGKFLLSKFESRSVILGESVEIWLAFSVLATRNLCDEASGVLDELDDCNLASARVKLARIVGRDTGDLDETEISRAVIETVAESFCDGVIAPLFYLTVGGAPLALAYKAANTLDSMIGHQESPYFYFGRFAAKFDDAANYIPARIGANLIIAAAYLLGEHPADARQIRRRDARLHASPNAGQTEAAMAGALNVRLGGTNFYNGAAHERPKFGSEYKPATPKAARRAIKIMLGAAAIGYFGAILVSLFGKKND